ncbi:sporulation initiation phosphotransferase B [Paraliobacillus quinghaiensis]|uniref:Sporulation initiation phosphotransferase B n=1 Tax=Paraliobacillus quinghaiensis TaxID=470815 RepID=A0A917TMB6_9BACI|nr:Spo0B domain-containing protein [Paraliobacillus quinghaiensis]GGM27392.1 sporulation initiation phosphotransferase B [Paraliobacillus quinghaiensis]
MTNIEEEDVVTLLRHYRHDWMNELQLIMGYAQMGKLDTVQKKIQQSVEKAESDRKLQNLPLPKTVIWVMQFNFRFDNFRLKYNIDANEKLAIDDQRLYDQLERIMEIFTSFGMKTEMYHGTMNIQQLNQQQLKVQLSFSGIIERSKELKNQIEHSDELIDVDIQQSQHDHEIYTVTWIGE